MTRVLVTGGVRSGKSAIAQQRVAEPGLDVTYVAAGPRYDDPDWQARIAAHRAGRPTAWRTVEPAPREVPGFLRQAGGAVIVECLGTWLTALLDDVGAWSGEPADPWRPEFEAATHDLVQAVADSAAHLVLVSNEVGWGLVSPHRSGRIFADELGRLNQRIAAVSETVVLAVSGLPLTVKGQ